ncbi:glycerophosphodiester phosphodiesterase GDPDL7 [Gossypium raimondii]|uniref:glycerophosphodiester phosphodiesterase n=1 Tax=Gossypium raimondii TaxID=29730 RepID=A0A0D2Q9L8_GOSRA|nr:glycerophosphodiester phosphodiesterase GDPDL7 [Gossypium raimondii]XP_012448235.1 glycerophosphodiester phosphodiesterase GDPDL7 [Gossypium raimondii]KJB54927.1 hypothetical protein B456_009G054700 [Gossypium raimondii]
MFGGKMIRFLVLFSLLVQVTWAQKGGQPAVGGGGGGGQQNAPPPRPLALMKKWPTLSGYPPLVIARGGFTGLFPESSVTAIDMALSSAASDLAVLCNLQLTKDSVGLCVTSLNLENTTNIEDSFPNASKTYKINGEDVKGYFAMDYSFKALRDKVTIVQNILSRPDVFDNTSPLGSVEEVLHSRPPLFWLNVQYDSFYNEHKLSMSDYIENTIGFQSIQYLSCTEIGFLKKMAKKVTNDTRLILTFLGPDAIEPTEKKKYSDILKDLKAVRAFASGILVPKEYIWPLNENGYLAQRTTLVADAHKFDLEVFAAAFANDIPGSYNYSYDPVAEYLQFINDPNNMVDGFVTDFSQTAANAIACLAGNDTDKKVNALIITHNGASGTYPGCTDLAYEQAVKDGADIIDCSVQMSKDGVAFCLDSPDLARDTTAMSTFLTRAVSIPEIQKEKGIFSFDLTWTEIQSLKPKMYSPFEQNSGLERNPEAKNKGKLISLGDFLGFAKTKPVGVLISIENARYLASKMHLDVVDAVTKTLKNASLEKKQVMIQSDDSAVLSKFKGESGYKRLLRFEEISGVSKQAAEEVKKYADGAVLSRRSLIDIDFDCTTKQTNAVKALHDCNVSVYVYVMRNEFVHIPLDYYADPTIEIATYVIDVEVDGIITEFPKTASRYLRSPCANIHAVYTILASPPGELLKILPKRVIQTKDFPPPPLEIKDIVDPPLPPVGAVPVLDSKPPPQGPHGAQAPAPSSGMAVAANFGFSLAAFMALGLLSMGH